jgi:hypothetical protein
MSFDKIEVRVFSGPDQVQVGSNTEPDLIVMNIGPKGDTGPAGPNSVTSATTSDGTANLSISNVSTTTATVSGLLTAEHIHGNLAGTLYTHVRTGEAMSKGDPFYISGFHVGSSQPIVMRADASDASKMPAVGVMDADYANNTSGANGIISGTLSSINTHGYGVNSPIYVKDGGGYSNVAGTIRQQVGITERANTNTGAFIVTNSKVISFADVSDAQTGTATLNLAGATIYPNGSITYASTNSGGAVGLSGQLATDFRNVKLPNASGNLALVASTTGAITSADITDATAVATAGKVAKFGANKELNAAWYTFPTVKSSDNFDISPLIYPPNYGDVVTGISSEAIYILPVQSVSGADKFALTGNTSGVPDGLENGTIQGETTFNATSYAYGTGAAAAHRTALGVVSNTDLLSSVYEWSKSTADYTPTNVGTGTSSTATNVMQLNTLAQAGSSALLRSDANDFRAWQKYSGNRQAVDWSKKTMHFVRISSDAFSGADTIFRIYLGLSYTLTTVQDLQSANTAIGFKVINGVIFVQVSNGSAVTTTTTGVTMSAWLVYDCMIQSNGDGTWTATVNSTTVTGSGAPTTTSAASNAALIMSATNGTTSSARRFFINIQRSMQHD